MSGKDQKTEGKPPVWLLCNKCLDSALRHAWVRVSLPYLGRKDVPET
jgi:hypothetical protein